MVLPGQDCNGLQLSKRVVAGSQPTESKRDTHRPQRDPDWPAASELCKAITCLLAAVS